VYEVVNLVDVAVEREVRKFLENRRVSQIKRLKNVGLERKEGVLQERKVGVLQERKVGRNLLGRKVGRKVGRNLLGRKVGRNLLGRKNLFTQIIEQKFLENP